MSGRVLPIRQATRHAAIASASAVCASPIGTP